MVDAAGRVAILAYDNLGRVSSQTLKPSVSSGTTYVASYAYDPVHGDLIIIDNVTAKITWTYDSLHRLKTEKLDVPSSAPTFTGTITYSYDGASKVTDIQYPAGLNSLHAAYNFDSLGRPVEVDYGGSKYAVLTYDPFGRLDNIHYWNGTTDTHLQEKYTYDARDRITQIKVFDGGSTTYMQLDYTAYSKVSEIIASTDNMYVSDSGTHGVSNPKAVTYSYDGNGRLASFTGPFNYGNQGAITNCYDYDAVGNILHWKTSSCATVYSYTYG